jgi:hypothetical protein
VTCEDIPEWSEAESYTPGQVVTVGGLSLYRAAKEAYPGLHNPVFDSGSHWSYLGHLEYQSSATPPQLIEQAEVIKALETARGEARRLQWKLNEIQKLIQK